MSWEILLLAVVIGTTIWVAIDSGKRDWRGNVFADRAWKWVVGCLLLWIVVFPIYLVARSRRPAGQPALAASQRLAMPRTSGIFWWGVGSAVAMAVGAFGPWVHVLGLSVSGTDGTNDGWIIVALAVLGLLCVLGEHSARVLAIFSILAGAAGVAVTLYDRNEVTSAIDDAGAFGAVASVGWGLNLALVGSASLAVHGYVAARHWGRPSVSTAPTAAAAAPLVRPYQPPFQTAPAAAPVDPPASEPTPAVALPAAGWYPDPSDSTRLRYWTGTGWGEQVAQIAPA